MMQGVVNQRCEATLPLVVGNANGQRQVIDAVIDKGFNGFLTLPSSIIIALDLSWNASDISSWTKLITQINSEND